MEQTKLDIRFELEQSNFDFMKLNLDLNEHINLVKEAEVFYAMGSYDASMINVRKESEALVDLILDLEYEVVPPRTSLNDRLRLVRKYLPNQITELFYQIKDEGNLAAHEQQGTSEKAEITLRRLRSILLWYLKEYGDIKIDKQPPFNIPRLSERFKNNQERKLIYIQSADNSTGAWPQYADAQKIGETTAPEDDLEQDWTPNSEFLRESARKRISSYMTTSGVPAVVNWSELAWNKSKKTWFGDTQVHEVLKRSNYKNHPILKGREWFQVDLDTAKEAIKAVKEGRSSLKVEKESNDTNKIVLRPEQNKAVRSTIKAFKSNNTMLWNAKMRFGKTLSTYELIKKQKYQKVLVVTHRPIVSDSWYEDFNKINMEAEGYEYASREKGELQSLLNDKEKSFVYFASIQDLRESNYVGGRHDKNREVFETDWDLIVIDEAHEGTGTELATTLFQVLIKEQTKVLELSGTPFSILDKYKDREDQVFTWDYVMEQQAKIRHSIEHPDLANPYESLPEIEMYTFKMTNENRFTSSGKYFDFSEFFKINDAGNFIHEQSVINWLDQISDKDGKNLYPFSNVEYRESIRHSLWLLPSVASAKELKRLLDNHKVFKEYTVLNIVDRDDNVTDIGPDMDRVRAAITDKPSETKTIILTVRKLTTGVNIPQLNAVVFLNNTTSAQSYLQAAFRAQTPFTDEVLGMKKKAYIFDFAPDRALNVLAQSVAFSPKAGALRTEDRENKLSELLNFLPVLEQEGNTMQSYSVSTMMRELKKAYAEKAVLSGFDDSSIYNDALWEVSGEDAEMFNQLQGKLKKTNQSKKTKQIDINTTGMDQEERELAKRAEKKSRKERTPEELELIQKERKKRNEVQNMIAILRSVSIRIPLMIYGMDIDLDADVSLETFVSKVDSVSWEEFMPAGFTKADFNSIKRFFDAEVFIEAGHRIRQAAISANMLSYRDRIEKITTIFSGFKNPDRETVLTPWRVVNLHLGKSIGGFNFFDENFEHELENGGYREINYKDITDKVFNKDSKVLEINSKTGLYPLYVAFSIYQYRYNVESAYWSKSEYTQKDKELWQEVLENNIYVLNKTPMARTITMRTLNGYEKNERFEKNLIYIENLVEKLRENPDGTRHKILKQFGDEEMKFDAVVGNPPYQESDGGARASARPIYHYFVNLAENTSDVSSLIMPSRWYVGGKGLDSFRDTILNSSKVRLLVDFLNPEDVFPNTNIRGGVCILMLDNNYDSKKNLTQVITYENNRITNDVKRPMKIDQLDIFIRDYDSIQILEKTTKCHERRTVTDITSPLRPFGFRGFFIKDKRFHKNKKGLTKPIICYGKDVIGFVEREEITVRAEWIDEWKVYTARANNIGTELNDDNFNTIIGEPGTICTETYLVIGASEGYSEQETINLSKYLKTKFARFLHGLAKSSHDAARQTYRFIPLQDFSESSEINWDATLSELDIQLFDKYGLSKEERDTIERKIKPMSNE